MTPIEMLVECMNSGELGERPPMTAAYQATEAAYWAWFKQQFGEDDMERSDAAFTATADLLGAEAERWCAAGMRFGIRLMAEAMGAR